MLKPELDAAVFGGEGVTFFSKSKCLYVFFSFGCEVSKPEQDAITFNIFLVVVFFHI